MRKKEKKVNHFKAEKNDNRETKNYYMLLSVHVLPNYIAATRSTISMLYSKSIKYY